MSTRWLSRAAAAAVLVAAGAGAWWLHVESGIELTPESVRDYVDELGPGAPILFTAAMAARPFLGLPSWLLMVSAGLLFGVAGGTLVSTLGGTLGALAAFGVARVLGRDALDERIRGRVARIDAQLAAHGPVWLGVYTAVPISPLSLVFLLAGLTSMRVLPFATAVGLGLLPRSALFAYFGSIALDPSSQDLLFASALVAIAIVMVLLSRRFVFGAALKGS